MNPFRIMTESVNSGKRASEAAPSIDHKRVKIDRTGKVVEENQVGITQYINEENRSGGFYGSIKQRYCDFLVNEIDLSNNVVHLVDEGINLGKTKRERNLEKRQEERAELQGKTAEEVERIKEQKKQELEQQPKYELSSEDKEKLLKLITEAELNQIELLFNSGDKMETQTKFEDKQTRTTLHQLLRQAFQSKLETVTTPENTFRIALARNNSARRRNPQESINHVDENGVVNYGLGPFKNYLHFTVYKENRETMEVASTISKFLRIPSKNIGYAGTKDRRGVTCQRFSILKGKVARVSSLNKGLKNVVLGGFTYEDLPLGLGDLKGNEFVITIRDVKPFNDKDSVETIIEKCFNSLQQKGFINYYGMQRFGTFSISTHELGIKILQEDWKGAVDLVLSEQEIVAPESIDARACWAETRNPSLTLKKMPRRCTAEYSILSVLEKERLDKNEDYGSNSYFKSIMAIPRNLRIMYAHAYQSYIWNLVVSKRFEMFGMDVQVGDLVLVQNEAPAQEKDVDGEDFEEDVVTSKFVRARPLTEEDIAASTYTIYDIVLPTPGFDILYPTNEKLMQVYTEVMAKDGLDPLKMNRRVREFSLAGSYRHIMGKPTNLSYKIVKYDDPNEPMVRTDLELTRLKKDGEENVAREIDHQEGERTGVVLTMQLPVSSYATMALREFMKADTSRFSDVFSSGK